MQKKNFSAMQINSQSKADIKAALEKAIAPYLSCDSEVITDIHIQVSDDTGDMTIFNDEDATLAIATIGEWADHKDEEDLEQQIKFDLCEVIKSMAAEHAFEKVNIMRPFSFVLVDESKETIEDLFIVDDDVLIVNHELLPDLDSDLNDFLENLLK